MRSWLFVPGDSLHKITKALAGHADVIILDLEDSVALQNKSEAREIVTKVLAQPRQSNIKIYVRVNALDSEMTALDIQATSKNPPDGYMLPKTNDGSDVQTFSQLSGTDLPIIAIATETASSLFNLGTYANLSAPLTAMTWGAEDLSSDLGAQTARDENGELTDPYRLARALCLAGARAANVQPVDSIYPNFRDDAGLKRECQAAVRDGFTGKMAIHPDQVPVINQTFTPSTEQIEHANKIIQAFKDAGDAGVISLNGQMYDRPHLTRAQKLIERTARYQPD